MLADSSRAILMPARISTVALSFVAALVLDFLPWKDLRLVPEFTALVLTFWCVRQPRLVGEHGVRRIGGESAFLRADQHDRGAGFEIGQVRPDDAGNAVFRQVLDDVRGQHCGKPPANIR